MLVALTDEKPEAAQAAADDLLKLLAETPPDALPEGVKPNSRQRAEALLRVPRLAGRAGVPETRAAARRGRATRGGGARRREASA